MNRINRIVVDSSDSISDLCELGAQYPTDKSPYMCLEGQDLPRHPYTAVYDLLFSTKRFEPLVLGEIGIASNMSMHMWHSYFPNATLYGFDAFPALIENAQSHGLSKTHYSLADINDRASVFKALNDTQKMFDVLIDDSTHLFDHQVGFVAVALEFVKPGGMLIVEDVFRNWDESRYHAALQPFYRFFASGFFIETNHVNRHSPGSVEPYFNNDKILVLFRNQEMAPRRHGPLVAESRLLSEAYARQSARPDDRAIAA